MDDTKRSYLLLIIAAVAIITVIYSMYFKATEFGDCSEMKASIDSEKRRVPSVLHKSLQDKYDDTCKKR